MPRSPQELYEKMAVNEEKHNQKLGRYGENKARNYLILHGWKILAKNYKNPFGEIDIIAKKKDVIAFIEVKTRLSDIFGLPAEAVDYRRKQRYIMGAKYFLRNRIVDVTVRFDIIEVFKGELNHIENAFGENG